MTEKFTTREAWLQAAIHHIEPLFVAADKTLIQLPAVRVSVGFPSTHALAKKGRHLGECWDKSAATDKAPHVFISPLVKDVLSEWGILSILCHELVHAVVGTACGHKGPFVKLGKAIGLAGKAKSMVAGPELMDKLSGIAAKLGDYPIGALTEQTKEAKEKKQTTRMIKCECETCGYTARTTSKWLEKIGPPLCPCNKEPMLAERPKDAPETDTDAEAEVEAGGED